MLVSDRGDGPAHGLSVGYRTRAVQVGSQVSDRGLILLLIVGTIITDL